MIFNVFLINILWISFDYLQILICFFFEEYLNIIYGFSLKLDCNRNVLQRGRDMIVCIVVQVGC